MNRFKKIEQIIHQGMGKDRFVLLKNLRALKKKSSSKHSPDLEKQIDRIEARAKKSAQRKTDRFEYRPANIHFDDNLPIVAKKKDIIQAIKDHPVVIISGETGSGKTTQIPKFCLEAGRGISGLIGCTQPRRIAAVNVARRISEELGQTLGNAVGYKIRFDDKTSHRAYIKLMTDGILLAETQTDPFLNAYDTIIVDEAHERSLNIDFTLGILRRLVKKRKNLKLIITSATIDTEKFSAAFDNAPVIEVSGRMYPVQTLYMPILGETGDSRSVEDQGYVEAAADAVLHLLSTSRSGDILVFMPSEQDIGETMELIRGRKMPGITVLPLFARLSAKEQSKVFSRQAGRKIIVATNVAETSLTIPGIKYVVDTGLARIPSYSPRTRTTALPVSPISQSSANQRLGRCGRVENGVCLRLFDENDFGARPFFTAPEILRSNLAEVILRMIYLNLGDVASFPFIDAPSPKSIKDGFDTLVELGAVTRQADNKNKAKSAFRLTRTGRLMARLPIDPKLSRILIEAGKKDCIKEAVIIATALSISDPRQRPAEKTQAADAKHALFKDPSSDFITLLNIWQAFKKARRDLKSRSKVRRWCQEHFLSFKRLWEWNDIHGQIIRIMDDHGMMTSAKTISKTGTKGLKSKAFEIGGPLYIALHTSLLTGYLAGIAHKKEKNLYNAAKGQQAFIFPGSGLFNSAGTWIVAAEFVKTSQLFARTVANIDPSWIEGIAKDLCTRTWSDPHWEKKRGEVVAKEQVSLFGLIIAGDRPVAYGKINPEEAGEIFIRNALVEEQVQTRFDFMTHNRKMIDDLACMEHKTRKKDILASPEDMFLFYRSKFVKPFYNIRTFARYLKETGSQDFLKMSSKDLIKTRIDPNELALFPDALKTQDGKFRLDYRFKPGSKKDGVTINVPAVSADRVSGHQIERLVPGLFEEKISALIKALPKPYRKKLVPVSQTAAFIAKELPKQDKPLFSLLSEFIQERLQVTIPAALWSEKDLPDHLKMRISIRDNKGKEIKATRTKSLLNEFSGSSVKEETNAFESAKKRYEKHQIQQWDFNDLEDHVIVSRQTDFVQKAWPGLKVDEKNPNSGLCLTLFRSQDQAVASHKKGIPRLAAACFPKNFKALKKDIQTCSDIRDIAPLFSGQTRFQTQVFNLIVTELFAENIRTKKEFEALIQKQIPHLYETGQTFISTVSKAGLQYKQCFDLLQKLSFTHQKKQQTFDRLTRLFSELKNLVPENFLLLYPFDRIRQLPRYIECLQTRAQKTVDNPMKLNDKTADLAGYTHRLDQLVADITPETSKEKSTAVEDFFWILEDYKISLFAQHLKTSQKVSKKKLDKILGQINTMI